MENKVRHGCVTTWIVFAIILHCSAVSSCFFNQALLMQHVPNISSFDCTVFGVLAILNIISYVLLLQWKRLGFYLFVVTSVLNLYFKIQIGINFKAAIFGLLGISVLYLVLQIKKDGISAWDNLQN